MSHFQTASRRPEGMVSMSPKREDGAWGPEGGFIGEKCNGLEEGRRAIRQVLRRTTHTCGRRTKLSS